MGKTKTKHNDALTPGMEKDQEVSQAIQDPERKERLEGILSGYWETEIKHYVNLSAEILKTGSHLDPYFVEKQLDLALELARAGLARYKHALRRYLGGENEL